MIMIPHAWPNMARRGYIMPSPVPLFIGRGGKSLTRLPMYPYRVGSSIETDFYAVPLAKTEIEGRYIGMMQGFDPWTNTVGTRYYDFMSHVWTWKTDTVTGLKIYTGKYIDTMPYMPYGPEGKRYRPIRLFANNSIPEKLTYPKSEYDYYLFSTPSYEKSYNVITPVIYSPDESDMKAYKVYKCHNVRNNNILGTNNTRWEDIE